MLGTRERCIARTAAQTCRRAGKEDGATPAGQHHPGHLAPHQEAGEAGHFPDLVVDAGGCIEDVKAHIGADVEDRCLDRCNARFDLPDQRDHLFLLACIRAKGVRLPSFCLDLRHQWRELVRIAPRHAGDVALTRKPPRDRAAGGIARTDDEHRLLLAHSSLLFALFAELKTALRFSMGVAFCRVNAEFSTHCAG
ncbi:hypothetical protein D9M72_562790 [compost metagenome]